MKTKDRIVDTALNLFNEKGSKGVSTNHIASACGISPGNLYYHFKNKEAIIHTIYERMVAEFDQAACLNQSINPNLYEMNEHFRNIIAIQWKYRFMQSELLSLIENDPWLKTQLIQLNKKRQAEMCQFIDEFIRVGKAKPLDPQSRQSLATVIWIISIFWQPFVGLCEEEVTMDRLVEGMNLIRFIVAPYLTEIPDLEVPG